MSTLCDVSAFIRMAGLRQRTIPESHKRRTRIDKILNKRSQDEIVISRSTVGHIYKQSEGHGACRLDMNFSCIIFQLSPIFFSFVLFHARDG